MQIADDVRKAEEFWVAEAQKTMLEDVKKGRFVKLQLKFRKGVILVDGRTERWLGAIGITKSLYFCQRNIHYPI